MERKEGYEDDDASRGSGSDSEDFSDEDVVAGPPAPVTPVKAVEAAPVPVSARSAPLLPRVSEGASDGSDDDRDDGSSEGKDDEDGSSVDGSDSDDEEPTAVGANSSATARPAGAAQATPATAGLVTPQRSARPTSVTTGAAAPVAEASAPAPVADARLSAAAPPASPAASSARTAAPAADPLGLLAQLDAELAAWKARPLPAAPPLPPRLRAKLGPAVYRAGGGVSLASLPASASAATLAVPSRVGFPVLEDGVASTEGEASASGSSTSLVPVSPTASTMASPSSPTSRAGDGTGTTDPLLAKLDAQVATSGIKVGFLDAAEHKQLYAARTAAEAKRAAAVAKLEAAAKVRALAFWRETKDSVALALTSVLQQSSVARGALSSIRRQVAAAIEAAVKAQSAAVSWRYGRLVPAPLLAPSAASATGARAAAGAWKPSVAAAAAATSAPTTAAAIEWDALPQPLELRLGLIRGVKSKLPPGRYVLLATLYDRLGGKPLRWTRTALGSGAAAGAGAGGKGPGAFTPRPAATTPVRHRGRHFDTDLVLDQCIYTTAPSQRDLRPGAALVFELFLLAGRRSPVDAVVGWGALPVCDRDFRLPCGKFRLPCLRGAPDLSLDRWDALEARVASDLDSWLGNLYLEAVPLPRDVPRGFVSSLLSKGGKGGASSGPGNEYQVEVAFTSALLRVRGEVRAPARPVAASKRLLLTGSSAAAAGSSVSAASDAASPVRQRGRNAGAAGALAAAVSAGVEDGDDDDGDGGDEEGWEDGGSGSAASASASAHGEKDDEKGASDDEAEANRWAPGYPGWSPSLGEAFDDATGGPRVVAPGVTKSLLLGDERSGGGGAAGPRGTRVIKDLSAYSYSLFRPAQTPAAAGAGRPSILSPAAAAKAASAAASPAADTSSSSSSAPPSIADAAMSSYIRGAPVPEAVRKLRYLQTELLADFDPRRLGWLSFEFWASLLLALLALWLRIYIHYLGQYTFLRFMRIPVYAFTFLPYSATLKYVPDAVPYEVEIGVVTLGPASVLIVMAVMAIGAWAYQAATRTGVSEALSRFIAIFGMLSIIHPALIAIVDVAAGRYDCTQRVPACLISLAAEACTCSEGDAWKLGRRFAVEDGSPLVGIVLTICIYLVAAIAGAFLTYAFTLNTHLNGRLRDVYRRLHASEADFFVPRDDELSANELRDVLARAKRWKGPDGASRHVAIIDVTVAKADGGGGTTAVSHVVVYSLHPPAGDLPLAAAAAVVGGGSARRVGSSAGLGSGSSGPLRTDPLSSPGTKVLYRHFVRHADGTIVEVFGSPSVGENEASLGILGLQLDLQGGAAM